MEAAVDPVRPDWIGGTRLIESARGSPVEDVVVTGEKQQNGGKG